jgi:dolichyl-phosphate beta-glucosyltransferase
MLSIVIPAFNEESHIQSTVQSIAHLLKPRFESVEILVVDDGSTDATGQIVSAMMRQPMEGVSIRLLQNKNNRGKGFSVKEGVIASSGDAIIFIDADLAFEAESILRIASGMSPETPLVIGTRNLSSSEVISRVSLLRFLSGRIFSLLIQFLVMRGMSDTQCGLKGFTATLAKKVFPRLTIDGFAFDVEMLYLSKKFNYKIGLIPVTMTENRKDSRVNMVWDPIKMFLGLIKIRMNDLAGRYG